MAAEMSCLTGVDEDDKDADSELNAHSIMQESMRMAQESASCTSSFGKPSLKQTIVLDVLSNTDMLSPVGLENGPALHLAVQDHELNSISSEKEEEKSITPLKTVQEIDNAGIWGFDVESPENSLDNFSSANDLNWDPHKEFMQFLWDNHSNSPSKEPKEEVSPVNIQRKRKRKMDMVVMVDPSEDLYPNLSPESSEESCDEIGQVDSGRNRVTNPEKNFNFTTPQSSPREKVSKHPNGTVKSIKEIIYKTPGSSDKNSINHKISPLRRGLMINSHSERSLCYPCSKCKLSFKKEHRLLYHMKSHEDPSAVSQKPFTCRECDQSFQQSGALIDHMSLHQEEKSKLKEEVKDIKDKKVEGRKITMFFCPQCSFGTTCPNTFVEHAKTHEKDKGKLKCDKCCFTTLNENDLRKHHLLDHTVVTVKKQKLKEEIKIFPCEMCSYKAFGKHVFQKHLIRRHQLTFDEYTEAHNSGNCTQPANDELPTYKSPAEDTEFTSKISIQNQICQKDFSSDESSSISDLFKNNKVKACSKFKATESKLDKSINVLLSRQSNGNKDAERKMESNNSSAQDSTSDKNVCDQTAQTMSVKVEFSARSPNNTKMNTDQSVVKKSSSKRKMSTPYRNTSDQDSCFILPKPLSSPKKFNLEDVADLEKDIFPGRDSEASNSYFDSGIKTEKKHIIYTYSRRMSMRGALQASKKLFEKIKTEEQEHNDPEIKEESIETEVFQETFESHQIPFEESPTDDLLELDSDQKNCPYCPAIFESGVGLSNHVRGHLHRVGLSYEERHAVPPEQVADQDRQPRIRRRFFAIRRFKKGTFLLNVLFLILCKKTVACFCIRLD